jgi:hypothetical protein
MPGDFINFNRINRSGHAVVFISFIGKNLQPTEVYSADVVGFRYFSAQGKNRPDAGFGFRNAFFNPYCPPSSAIQQRDCGVIKSNNSALLNSGSMHSPDAWSYSSAIARRSASIRGAIENDMPDATRGAIDQELLFELERELSWNSQMDTFFSGVTTD